MRKLSWLLITLPLLQACCHAPTAPDPTQGPRVPDVQWDAPEPSFTDPMASFLHGKLPAPRGSASNSSPAKANTTK